MSKRKGQPVLRWKFPGGDVPIPLSRWLLLELEHYAAMLASGDPELVAVARAKMRELAQAEADTTGDANRLQSARGTANAERAAAADRAALDALAKWEADTVVPLWVDGQPKTDKQRTDLFSRHGRATDRIVRRLRAIAKQSPLPPPLKK